MSEFVHLHTHSHYSLLNALPKIKELVGRAKACGMDALALTDDGNLYGVIEFYKECKKQEIQPIIGVDFYVAVRTRHDKQAGIDNRRHRLVLLAKDVQGYRNLIKLVTDSNLEGFYYKPRIDHELMEKNKSGLIAILPSFSSEVSNKLKNGDTDGARELIDYYKGVYGSENLYLEVTHHPEIDGHDKLIESIVSLARETDTPIVASHDVYYLDPSDKLARNTLTLVQGSSFANRDQNQNEDFSFIDIKTAKKYFKHLPEALHNTQKIADACAINLDLGTWSFPRIDLPEGKSADEVLSELAHTGFVEKKIEPTQENKERLEYELEVIKNKGYSPYFLIVSDLLRFARENSIYSTIRGSVAGSLVTYCVGITKVNPLEYNLPFERFLNPERPSAPDIDMDFADDRRDEVIAYARQKYGSDKVAQIGTFGTMLARGSVRDTARALGYPYAQGDEIAKLIPMGKQGFPMTIKKALEVEPDLKKLYDENEDAREIIDLAKKIEGSARHISVHAAGVVIAPTALTDFVPLQVDPKGGKLITQFDMRSVEEAGLIKFDFLGLTNLAILADVVKRVKWRHGIDLDLEAIPLDDKKTFEMLARGETHGIFQLNGSGMTAHLKELQPTEIHDINAMVALYRPGPMAFIPDYIARKQDPRKVTYLDPRFEEILHRSYGVITYQDDVLAIAIKFAGYSWLEADKFRKAMGKKIQSEMQAQKEKFMTGCREIGKMDEDTIHKLWAQIETFAAYGFNKAHAASYGRVAYQTAYMKANYPVEYMAAILTADSGNTDKISEVVKECTRMHIPVLGPDINESFGTFTIVEEDGTAKIRFGLYSIKNVGKGIADVIIEDRSTNGKFTSLSNFLERINDRNLNKKTLEALIQTGALDEFGERGQMLANIDHLLAYGKEFSKSKQTQDSLFALMDDPAEFAHLRLADAPPASTKEKLSWEKELLGLYLSGHPLDPFREKLEGRKNSSIEAIKTTYKEGMIVVPAGIIEDVRTIFTKKGERMAFVQIADFSDSIEVVIFPSVYSSFEKFLKPEKCIAIKGKLSLRNQRESVIAEAVREM